MAGENDTPEQEEPEVNSDGSRGGGYDWDEGPIDDAPDAFLRSAMMGEDDLTMPAPDDDNPPAPVGNEPASDPPEPEAKAGNEPDSKPDTGEGQPVKEEPKEEAKEEPSGPDPVVSFFSDLHPEIVIDDVDGVREHIQKQSTELAEKSKAVDEWRELLQRHPKLGKVVVELATNPDMSEDKAVSMLFSELFAAPDAMDDEEVDKWNKRRDEVLGALETRSKLVSDKEQRWDGVIKYYESKIKDGMTKGLVEELGASEQEAATTVKVGHTMLFGDQNGRRMDPKKFLQTVYRGVYFDKLLKAALADKEASIEKEVNKRVNAELEKANPGANPLRQVPNLNGGQTPINDPSQDPNFDPNLVGVADPRREKFEFN